MQEFFTEILEILNVFIAFSELIFIARWLHCFKLNFIIKFNGQII
jgi:hypothetical protein